MSATQSPYGMIPIARIGSAYNTQGLTPTYRIESGYNTIIRFGDVVRVDSDGFLVKETRGSTACPVGVFVGCEYTSNDGLNYRLWGQQYPGGISQDDTYAYVVDDPDAVFEVQADGSVGQTALGANAGIVQTPTSNQFGKSRNALDASSVSTTASLPLRIVGFSSRPESRPGDAFTDVLVKMNQHALRKTTGV